MLTLKDKNGNALFHQCIIYGSLPNETQKHYWNLGMSATGDEFEMIACTYGYVHAVQPKHLVNMELVGSLEDHKHLLKCD